MKKSFFLGVTLFFLVSVVSQSFGATLYVEWCPVTGVTGYKVYYGTESGVYPNSWDNGDSLIYESDSLAEGVYFVAVSAYDADLVESPLSDEKIAVVVENGDSATGWLKVKGVAPVAGYDSYSALFFSGVTGSTAVASNKISLAGVPATATYLSYKFKATGSGGYVSIILTTKSKGTVTLSYKLQDTNVLGSTSATFGIGAALKDGQWHAIERDLDADLVTAGIAPTGDIVSFSSLFVYSYYDKSFKLSTVGLSQNPNGGACP